MATSVPPKVILRLGSHAEKEYFLKTIQLWSGLIVGANLLEAAPGATASLIFKFAGEKFKVPYYLDPMTYAFGTYIEHGSTTQRTDLDWIKSDQRDRKTKKVERRYKRSYRQLAGRLGGAVLRALSTDSGIAAGRLNGQEVTELAAAVVDYQMSRVREEFAADPEFSAEAERVPTPAAVFAPYFYIDPSRSDDGLAMLASCATAAKNRGATVPVFAVLCTDVGMLKDADFLARAASAIIGSGVDGVWLWFSQFDEPNADDQTLRAFRDFVLRLEPEVDVYNMHGGYYSLALSRLGLNGVSHGIGYGEQKDVIPVIGQSTPTVRYYLPDGRYRLGVPEIERALSGIGVTTANEFFEQVCGCAICRGVIKGDLAQFSAFGDLHYSTPRSARRAQTPAAAQRCRYHFLLNRARECSDMAQLSAADVATRLAAASSKWAAQPTVARSLDHLLVWSAILGSSGSRTT